jgi:hypothetical protein
VAGTSSAEAASAPTSPQAFSRHQIQRNTSTTPTPAPSSRLATQAARIDASWVITAKASASSSRFEPRATRTSVRAWGARPLRGAMNRA